jgi:hypothetical protein
MAQDYLRPAAVKANTLPSSPAPSIGSYEQWQGEFFVGRGCALQRDLAVRVGCSRGEVHQQPRTIGEDSELLRDLVGDRRAGRVEV